ncbi:MAG: DUF5671 domain-containing protein [Candidatus Nealsonbacteria bacterium]|nr:DUF5671 domain-containing protein [Candidatus Nealsonbacteria bacterium]
MANTLKKNTPRDVFLHLLTTITLYWSAVSFITLLWQFINHFLPDQNNLYYIQSQYYLETMRFAIASLIIVFPVYILVSWYLNRNYLKNPEIREMKLRKWLIYFTLFVAALVIIGDLVSVILNFLRGDTTLRFILKAFSVIIVAGGIFGYYLDDVKRDKPSSKIKYFVWLVCIIVAVSIIGSFFIIGSPKETRLRLNDEMIIGNLENIQSQIVNYWQKKEMLPESLSALIDPISGFIVPTEPKGANYEYVIRDAANLKFELCAVFNKEGKTQVGVYSAPVSVYINAQNWDHSAGRVCFERQIDKELYPVIKK